MPRNDKITINTFSVPDEFPGEEWKTFISILYHESADDVIKNLVNAEIERIIKEDSASHQTNHYLLMKYLKRQG